MKNKRRQSQTAFTLLEVLISIALFAIIGAGVAGTMSQMTKVTKKLRIKEATVLTGQVALDRIQRDLQMAYNEKVQHSPCFFKANNVGAGPELTFSFLDSELKVLFETRTAGVQLVRYFVEKAENGTLNLLRATGSLFEGENIRNTPGSLVATGVLDWKIEYYDAQNDLWHAEWDTASPQNIGAFPKAIRLSLKTVDPALPQTSWKDKALNLSTEFLVLNESEVR